MKSTVAVAGTVYNALRRLPALEGRRIAVEFRQELTAHRGKLLSGRERGLPVHGGSFPRQRRIVLDAALLHRPGELSRILVHELFHFVWLRLGNRVRRSFEALLVSEWERGARGELGWSSQRRKDALDLAGARERTRKWREYIAESFADTAAFLYSSCRRHEEYTLAPRFRARRRDWFAEQLAGPLRV